MSDLSTPATLAVAIVDDEVNARAAIRVLLTRCGDVEIVAECRDGVEAVEFLNWATVDLLFLDIQMPGLDGFGVIAALPIERVPPTVFVTAYDAYAIRAFEVEALDYLLKPFDERRFFAAFSRARQRIDERRTSSWARELLAATHRAPSPPPSTPARLPVVQGGRIVFVEFQHIDWIEAADQYVILHVGAKEYLLREALHRLAARLPRDVFAQIHRSHVVNLAKVREIVRRDKGDATVVLTSGRQLRLSRRYRDAIRGLLGPPSSR